MNGEKKECAGCKPALAQMAAGLSHRVGRRPLRHPPRDGEVPDARLVAAGGGELDHRLCRQVPASRIACGALHRRSFSAGAERAHCCSATPRIRTHALPSARRRESWLPIRRSARICLARWCMTRRRMHCSAHATTAYSTLTGQPVAGPPTRPLPRIKLEQRGDRLFATELEA